MLPFPLISGCTVKDVRNRSTHSERLMYNPTWIGAKIMSGSMNQYAQTQVQNNMSTERNTID